MKADGQLDLTFGNRRSARGSWGTPTYFSKSYQHEFAMMGIRSLSAASTRLQSSIATHSSST